MKNSSCRLIILLLCLLCACNQAKKSIEETLHPKAQKSKAAGHGTTATDASSLMQEALSALPDEHYPSIFESASTLDSIQQALQNLPKLKGKKLFFWRGLTFYDYKGGIISVDLQDPDQPENVDTYTYSNGQWEMQNPVKINGHFPLKLLLAPLDEIRFRTAKKVYAIGLEKSKGIEGAQPISHVYFNQLREVKVKEWYLMINGARHDYYLRFNANGDLMTMK